MPAVPLYTIRRAANGYVLQGPILPRGCWFIKCTQATQFARRHLTFGDGAQVEVYGPGEVLFLTFVVAGDGSPVPAGVLTGWPLRAVRAIRDRQHTP